MCFTNFKGTECVGLLGQLPHHAALEFEGSFHPFPVAQSPVHHTSPTYICTHTHTGTDAQYFVKFYMHCNLSANSWVTNFGPWALCLVCS